jgi:hypothetical protein
LRRGEAALRKTQPLDAPGSALQRKQEVELGDAMSRVTVGTPDAAPLSRMESRTVGS